MTRIEMIGTARQGVDQLAGKHRHEQVGDGGAKQTEGNDERHHRLLQPVAEHERHDDIDRRRLFGSGIHGFIRLALARGGRLHLRTRARKGERKRR